MFYVSALHSEYKCEKNLHVLQVQTGVVDDSVRSILGILFLIQIAMGQKYPDMPIF